MKTKLFITFIVAASVMMNIYYFIRDEKCVQEVVSEEVFMYPADHSSIDFELSYDPENPQYRNFSLEGDSMIFANFYLKGSMIDSYNRKYDKRLSDKLIRNIQEIVYFLNDYKIWFNERDRITLFYNEKDEKIIYLRFRNAVKKTLSDVYLFETIDGERYVNSDDSFLQPCISNGPFEGCPDVRFINEDNTLVPVFDVRMYQNVKLPFLAKLTNVDHSRNTGGELEFVYSNYAVKAFFKGMGYINDKLKKNSLYKKDAVIGKSGFVLQDGSSGVIYFLRKNENTPVSPFLFHHIERKYLPEKYNRNFQIVKSFYARQLEFGLQFEKQYY
ncbi:MAG TPA: hypothetical protein VLJ60_03795 [bacterium]|nr:hypothetical protein [bacterium]